MSNSVYSSAVWPNYSTTNVTKASTKSNELGKDQFLGLLVAQLQNQDPLSPMDNTQFIAQMAQFSSVEQLVNMSKEISMLRLNIGTASNLIGKTVSWNEYDSQGKVVVRSGVVDSIISKDNNLFVQVNGNLIGMDFIGQITEGVASTGTGTDNNETNVVTEPTENTSTSSNNEVSEE